MSSLPLAIFVAHPIKPVGAETLEENVAAAERWRQRLQRANPRHAFLAPYVDTIRDGEDDRDPAQRAAGIARTSLVSSVCHGIALCGPRISAGMVAEMLACGQEVRSWPMFYRFDHQSESLKLGSDFHVPEEFAGHSAFRPLLSGSPTRGYDHFAGEIRQALEALR